MLDKVANYFMSLMMQRNGCCKNNAATTGRSGFGGACPEGYQAMAATPGNWPACHSQREHGTELWSLAGQPVGDTNFLSRLPADGAHHWAHKGRFGIWFISKLTEPNTQSAGS